MKNIILFALALSVFPTNVWAQSDYEDNYEGSNYEEIVRELSVNPVSRSKTEYENPFDTVRIHVGAGFATSTFTVSRNDNDILTTVQGVQTSLGIDLFDPNWIAEGVLRSYNGTEINETRVSANEFDLRVIYLHDFSPIWKLNMGAGLGAKYMKIKWEDGEEKKYQSPTSVFVFGLNSYLSPKFSIGGELAARSPLTDGSPDTTAMELALKLNGHF